MKFQNTVPTFLLFVSFLNLNEGSMALHAKHQKCQITLQPLHCIGEVEFTLSGLAFKRTATILTEIVRRDVDYSQQLQSSNTILSRVRIDGCIDQHQLIKFKSFVDLPSSLLIKTISLDSIVLEFKDEQMRISCQTKGAAVSLTATSSRDLQNSRLSFVPAEDLALTPSTSPTTNPLVETNETPSPTLDSRISLIEPSKTPTIAPASSHYAVYLVLPTAIVIILPSVSIIICKSRSKNHVLREQQRIEDLIAPSPVYLNSQLANNITNGNIEGRTVKLNHEYIPKQKRAKPSVEYLEQVKRSEVKSIFRPSSLFLDRHLNDPNLIQGIECAEDSIEV